MHPLDIITKDLTRSNLEKEYLNKGIKSKLAIAGASTILGMGAGGEIYRRRRKRRKVLERSKIQRTMDIARGYLAGLRGGV